MSHHTSDIDKKFKEGLFDYTAMPDAKVWQNLESRLECRNAKRKLPSASLLVLLGIGIAAACMLWYNKASQKNFKTDIAEVQNFMHTAEQSSSDIIPSNGNGQAHISYSANSNTGTKDSNSSSINENSKALNPQIKVDKQSNHAIVLRNSEVFYQDRATALQPRSQDAVTIETSDKAIAESMPSLKNEVYSTIAIARLPLMDPSLNAEVNHAMQLGLENRPILVRKMTAWKLANIDLKFGLGNAFRSLKDDDASDVNKKYFNQYESKGNAWSAGIGIAFQKSRHWSIQTGLHFSSATIASSQPLNAIYNASGKSEGIYSTSFNNNVVHFIPANTAGLTNGDLLYYQVKANQTATQINLPLIIAYKILFGRLGMEVGLGGQASVIARQHLGIDNASNLFVQYYTENAENNKKLYWSTLCKIQLSYPISSRFDWQLGAQYDFANSAANSGKSVQYLPFNKYITTGLSMHF